MKRTSMWKLFAITFSIITLASFGAVGQHALAQETEAVPDVEYVEVAIAADAYETVVELLQRVRSELDSDVLEASTPAEWDVIAAYIVNLLKGPEGEHFQAEYTLSDETLDQGIIAYVEALAGATAADFAEEDIAALLQAEEVPAVTAALLHLLQVNDLLLSETVDLNVADRRGGKRRCSIRVVARRRRRINTPGYRSRRKGLDEGPAKGPL